MPKGKQNKRYTPEFKKLVLETMLEEKLSYSKTARRFDLSDHHCIQDWKLIHFTERLDGFAVEQRGRGRKGRPDKQLSKKVEEDLLVEMQRHRPSSTQVGSGFPEGVSQMRN